MGGGVKALVKIINGKKYSTETAKEVAKCWNGLGYEDFNYMSETLYQKKTGEFFLYAEGGALTKYAEACGGTRYGSEKIILLTLDKAKEWCAKYCDGETYIEIFGDVEE